MFNGGTMTTTFTWSIAPDGISTITYGDRADTVVQVRYKLTATDGLNTEAVNGVVELTPSDGGAFTPYENLTQEQVIEWVKAVVRPVDLAHYELRLNTILERKANPPPVPVIKPAPWNTCVQA